MLGKTKTKIIFFVLILFLVPLITRADYLGQRESFFVDPSYDLDQRKKLTASLQFISPQLYFYIDDNWWNKLDSTEKEKTSRSIQFLADEFQYKIYPTLTSNFGLEWKLGIDEDFHITLLFHPMAEEAAGYFNSADEYSIIQAPTSNEREMVYLNTRYINDSRNKSFLAHEFMHLIIFNQKERIQGVTEETWLNEARAEYVPTFLGYDADYEGSNLQDRVRAFINNPSDSLTEWKNRKADYGVANLFVQYLVDHYGVKILIDSLHSSQIGIPSLNEALSKNGFAEDFSQIFTDWTITVLLNNCSLNKRQCYANPNLKNLRITPSIIFLPSTGKSTLSVTYVTKNWAGNWYKIIGGQGKLKVEFTGPPELKFKIPYVIKALDGKDLVGFYLLDQTQKGTVYIPSFGKENVSFILIPSIQSKTSNFSDEDPLYSFSISTSITEEEQKEDQELIKKLLERIDALKAEIATVQAQIDAILAKRSQNIPCPKFEENLYYGLRNDDRVSCLQQFLKAQGLEIYPEGLITGNFLSLTQAAVIRFQEKYASEILEPLGLKKGTGFVGPQTITQINQILGK